VFVCTGDNQGTDNRVRTVLVNAFFNIIVDNLSDTPLPEDKEAEKLLADRTKDLKLHTECGAPDSPFRSELDGTVYECLPNPMGITEFSFKFSEDGKEGVLCYTNAQGKKELPFGINFNKFGKFPQLGYSNDFGGLRTTDGFMYKDAVSAAWLEDKKIIVTAQIIDRYFGIMSACFGFNGEYAAAQFTKIGEDFLAEYGITISSAENDGKTLRNIVRDSRNAITADSFTLVCEIPDGEYASAIADSVEKFGGHSVIQRECAALELSDGAEALLLSSAASETYAGDKKTDNSGNYCVGAVGFCENEFGEDGRVFVT
jgi:hypothetical protein